MVKSIEVKSNKLIIVCSRIYYPVAILDEILNKLPNYQVGVLYDIGCHLDVHIKKVIYISSISKTTHWHQFHFCKSSQRNLIPHHDRRLLFGTSVFHAYVHEWACQIKYNPRFNQLWGLSDGEGLERLWSFLSRLIAVLRTSTRLNRLQAIQLCADFYAEIKLDRSGRLFMQLNLHYTQKSLLNLSYWNTRPLAFKEAQECSHGFQGGTCVSDNFV